MVFVIVSVIVQFPFLLLSMRAPMSRLAYSVGIHLSALLCSSLLLCIIDLVNMLVGLDEVYRELPEWRPSGIAELRLVTYAQEMHG